ncbi:MAG: Transcriptional regulatory protein tctD [Paracidovorax wautersii]|uniref:Transcriptional regulatory protein tctD n=1 Tax=Paracidovorax wautersii TaxID=1177982 RepID=A0A7V8FPV2_9BURK|nr:MAG: Transcriptional regulatory protein tctD [Paracidovorax wautersii]
MKILLVEDEAELAAWLARALGQSRFLVELAQDGLVAERFLKTHEYDAVVLDVQLPGKDGFAVLAGMRARDDRTPVLMLTAQGALEDRVRGLQQGADDFLAKPFALAELEARLFALIRRSQGKDQPRLQVGPLSFDVATRAFWLGGEPLPLTPREHAALSALVRRGSRPVSKAQLFDLVFDADSEAQADAVDVVLHRLRKKLAARGVEVVTVRGVGYMLKAAGDGQPAPEA